MIIHNPIVSGSLRFPSDDNNNLITLQVVNGTLETLTLNSSGVNQNIQPAVNYSGSFTGSFIGDGSSLTGIAATSFNIDALDALGGASVAQGDNFLISDAGTEKKVTFSNLEDSIFGNVSGDITIAAGGSATLGNAYINTSLNAYTASNDTTNSAQDTRLNQLASATGSYLTTVDISSDTNLSVSDTTNVDMILSGDTLSANLKGGVVSGSSQIDGTGISNNSITIAGTSVSLNGSIGLSTIIDGNGIVSGSSQLTSDFDSRYLNTNGDGVISGSSQVNADTITNFDANVRAAVSATGDLSYDSGTGQFSFTNDAGDIEGVTAGAGLVGGGTSGTVTLAVAGGVISGSAQLLNVATDFGSGRVSGDNFGDSAGTSTFTGSFEGDGSNLAGVTSYTDSDNTDHLNSLGVVSGSSQVDGTAITNNSITISGTSVSLGGSITDETLFGGVGVVSGSSQITLSSTTGYDANEHIDHTSVSITAGTGLNGGGTIAATRTLNVDSDYKNDSLNTFTASLDTDLATFSVPASTTISSFGKTLVDDADASAARTTLGVDAAGTDNSTDVTLSGTPNYITISGQVITRNTIDIGDDTNLTAGTGITLSGDTLSTTDSEIVHDNLSGFVANEHIDHSSITIGSGKGLSGGGTITVSRSLTLDTGSAHFDGGVSNKLTSLNTFSASLSTNLADLTDDEVAQLENIGSTTISSTQWGYLGALNQGLTQTSNVNFGDLTLSGDLTVNGETSYISSSVVQIGDNIIELNGTGGANGGIYVRDAVSTTNTGSFIWDTTNDYWKAGAKGSENEILTVGNVDADIKTFSLPASTTISAFGKTLVDDANASTARTTLGVDAAGTDNSTDVTLANTNYLSISGQVLTGGTVPVGSGGTGATTAAGARSALGVDAAGTDNSTDVTLANTNYLSISGQTLTGGTVPIGSGGTGATSAGAARTALGVDAAGTDNSTDVTLAGSYDYITISGQAITRNQINLTTDVTGVLPSANLDADTAHLSGTQTFSGAKTFSAAVNISNSTASTTKTTGALVVTGGVGVSGALNVGGDVVAYASSDERLKDNIELISNPIEKVQSLKGVTWNWNENADELQQSLPNVGVIAQDVEKVLPQLVTDRDSGFKGVDYAKLTGLLIEAIKDQQKQIDELKSKLS